MPLADTLSTRAAPRSVATPAPLIVWTPELSVGIDEIDAQHKLLVDLLNQLHVAILTQHGSAEAMHVLHELIDYTRIHFAVEESLMRVLGYPDYEAHKASHEQLLEQVLNLQRRLIDEGQGITFELLHFLKRWLSVHIMETDRSYTPHFLARGIQARYEKPSLLRRLWSRAAPGAPR
ncbi:bacteriohemerythrin [Solimonas marina]|uniref:Bacteriohemerythrin n=1 Tax=Solimonas marina TaxID=2714601 RepID=A0A969W7D7_9GAMM|nr:bacteriohemerythrin [Solimonas marina]NKF20950.1 bacteriohemerythrin [Solimonas marina]